MRDKVRDHLAAFTSRLKLPRALCHIALLSLKRNQLIRTGQRLAVAGDQFRLVVKRVDMTAGPRAEDHDNSLRRRRKVRLPRRKRPRGINVRPDRRLPADATLRLLIRPQQPLLRQHHRQCDAAKARGRVIEKTAAVEKMSISD